MFLLNIYSLQLEHFLGDDSTPPYFILSHTWGDEEVTYQDVISPDRSRLAGRKGWQKIVGFCDMLTKSQKQLLGRTFGATDTDIQHAWVDTCCINKDSSAELSESINSMFRWYQNAVCCVVWLPDVQAISMTYETLHKSRWFTRGWTLQELLAPRECHFYNEQWEYMGNRLRSVDILARITQIHPMYLDQGFLQAASISERMSWASKRRTTRAEDCAYSLLGIFDINMPLLYGEGGEKAFVRLQEEILKESTDESIFAWDASDLPDFDGHTGMLATHPRQFHDGAGIIPVVSHKKRPEAMRSGFLHMKCPHISYGSYWILGLHCSRDNGLYNQVGVPVHSYTIGSETAVYRMHRKTTAPLFRQETSRQKDVLFQKRSNRSPRLERRTYRVQWPSPDLELLQAWPGPAWSLVEAQSAWVDTDERGIDRFIDLNVRLARVIAHDAGLVTNSDNTTNTFCAALAFRCLPDNRTLFHTELFVLGIALPSAGDDLLYSFTRIPGMLATYSSPALYNPPLWNHISAVIQKWGEIRNWADGGQHRKNYTPPDGWKREVAKDGIWLGNYCLEYTSRLSQITRMPSVVSTIRIGSIKDLIQGSVNGENSLPERPQMAPSLSSPGSSLPLFQGEYWQPFRFA